MGTASKICCDLLFVAPGPRLAANVKRRHAELRHLLVVQRKADLSAASGLVMTISRGLRAFVSSW
jgi:hypothetical protein